MIKPEPITRREAQEILGIKNPVTFWLKIARAGIRPIEERIINKTRWHYYHKKQIEKLKKDA